MLSSLLHSHAGCFQLKNTQEPTNKMVATVRLPAALPDRR
jgi:hypothetical protein